MHLCHLMHGTVSLYCSSATPTYLIDTPTNCNFNVLGDICSTLTYYHLCIKQCIYIHMYVCVYVRTYIHAIIFTYTLCPSTFMYIEHLMYTSIFSLPYLVVFLQNFLLSRISVVVVLHTYIGSQQGLLSLLERVHGIRSSQAPARRDCTHVSN